MAPRCLVATGGGSLELAADHFNREPERTHLFAASQVRAGITPRIAVMLAPPHAGVWEREGRKFFNAASASEQQPLHAQKQVVIVLL
mmetsp:Transcript_35206/g.101120  ORF Transcript_35206/g.101120 Transcript_35206/m.101120 type:complete len:87 (-) Transcript_35206:226-486(-)